MKTERELFEKAYVKTDHYYINYEKTNASNSAFSWNEQANRYTWHDVNSAWNMWQTSAQREGYKLVPKEPSAELVNLGHQVFLGHFNEGGRSGGQSLYFAYKAMIGAAP